MNKAGLLAAGTVPGIVFGYALLAGILMKRISPVPIVKIGAHLAPDAVRKGSRREPAIV
jgi:hypothetical protein